MGCWKQVKGVVKLNEPLSRHTTFRIGGAAEVFIEPRDAEQLRLAITLAKRHKKKVFIIGAGSNLLVGDKGLKGVVIRLNSPVFKKVRITGTRVDAGAGVLLARLSHICAGRGLSGLEFFAGIPGSAGGALIMNAGAWGKNIEDYVENIRVMDYNGNIKLLGKKDIRFEYRNAQFCGLIVLECFFSLRRLAGGLVGRRIRDFSARRIASQDLSKPSAGCIFKNPPGVQPAGKLIDICGLKGMKKGGAAVSEKHANFIVNLSHASCRDVRQLMSLIKRRVRARFGVVLEPEVKIWC
jgi:UDP-N-acetylmuramate dehydrogenase